MKKMEDRSHTCTTSDPVSWHASTAHLHLRSLLTMSKGLKTASMRGGVMYYVREDRWWQRGTQEFRDLQGTLLVKAQSE
jgi:hypothetical protein